MATRAVTNEHLDLVWRVHDGRTGEPFYRVQSETDPTRDYTVRAIKVGKKYFVTCTCPAGQEGFVHAKGYCKHVRWSLAHARLSKELTQARIIERFPIPKSSIVSWTIQEGLASYQVMQYSKGFTCDCYSFSYESGLTSKSPSRAQCVHIDAVKAEIARLARAEQKGLRAA